MLCAEACWHPTHRSLISHQRGSSDCVLKGESRLSWIVNVKDSLDGIAREFVICEALINYIFKLYDADAG